MKHTKMAAAAIHAGIPPTKLRTKVLRVIVGLSLAAVGVGLRVWLGAEVPWWVPAGACALGFHISAGELVNRTLVQLPTLVGAACRDILAGIVQGKRGNPGGGEGAP
jgi:hypothetical protein